MKVYEWMDLIKYKKEHYPISDNFIREYQQGDTGYIKYAKKVGHIVDKSKAEPNQRWHLFESYIFRMLAEREMSLEDSAESVYGSLKCPELLLWIAEASGVDDKLVEETAQKAKQIIEAGIDGRARNSAGNAIRNSITWEKIQHALINNE